MTDTNNTEMQKILYTIGENIFKCDTQQRLTLGEAKLRYFGDGDRNAN
jgi:hypothetical protein